MKNIDPKLLKEITSNLNILYAEDEETLRRGMVQTLKRLFKNVYVAEDGYEGIELYKNHDIDLILTDINMPNINGIEMIEAITALEEFPPPFIVLTAHNESDFLLQLINLGVDKFLLKPVDRVKMIDSLYKVCSVLNDKLLIEQYHKDIEQAYEESEKQKRILENRLKQIAYEKNKQQSQIEPKKTVQEEQISEEKKLSHYEMLNSEDSDELEDLCIEMDAYISMMFQSDGIEDTYIHKLADAINKYGSILNLYPLFTELSLLMKVLSNTILDNADILRAEQNKLASYFESLHYTLEAFRVNVWVDQTEDPTFFNASFM